MLYYIYEPATESKVAQCIELKDNFTVSKYGHHVDGNAISKDKWLRREGKVPISRKEYLSLVVSKKFYIYDRSEDSDPVFYYEPLNKDFTIDEKNVHLEENARRARSDAYRSGAIELDYEAHYSFPATTKELAAAEPADDALLKRLEDRYTDVLKEKRSFEAENELERQRTEEERLVAKRQLQDEMIVKIVGEIKGNLKAPRLPEEKFTRKIIAPSCNTKKEETSPPEVYNLIKEDHFLQKWHKIHDKRVRKAKNRRTFINMMVSKTHRKAT